MDPSCHYLPPSDRSLEGLGILCDNDPTTGVDNYGPNFAYEDSFWEAQANGQTYQFQQRHDQNRCIQPPQEASLLKIESPGSWTSTPQVHIINDESCAISCVSPSWAFTPALDSFEPSVQGHHHHESFSRFEIPQDYSSVTNDAVHPNNSKRHFISPQPMSWASSHRQSLPTHGIGYNLPAVYATPYLQPSLEIHDSISRRLSVSSTAPSSIFSNDCQDTPYFMTPGTTPQFAPSSSTEYPCTPMSGLSSPGYSNHLRSPSSTSHKLATPGYRPIRPAPYSLDAAQRQRWSTGKTMSLPSRRAQHSEPSFSRGHMRTVSERNVSSMYFSDDFAAGECSSFNRSLEIIRQGLPTIVPSIEKDDLPTPVIKAEEREAVPKRLALAAIQPKSRPLAPAPASVQSPPVIPPLNLPEQFTRPLSPPAEDLSPSNSAAPKQNPVSPNDVYTPKYSRGTKGKLEGYCGFCKPGRWLNMKTSAYWYDKQCNHGINPKTKRAFDLPVDRRWKMGSSVIREGLCGVCNEWAAMDSVKRSWKKWWKHAYKCHNKSRDFDYEIEDDDDEQDLANEQHLEIPQPAEALFQHLQPVGYMQSCWPYMQAHL